jgi:hypothetical protein
MIDCMYVCYTFTANEVTLFLDRWCCWSDGLDMFVLSHIGQIKMEKKYTRKKTRGREYI